VPKRQVPGRRGRRLKPLTAVLLSAVVAAGCGGPGGSAGSEPSTGAGSGSAAASGTGNGPRETAATGTARSGAGVRAPSGRASANRKVLVVWEENRSFDEIIGSAEAPYLNGLAHRFGLATAYDAGYPARCPSLAAYILLASGGDRGICDDDGPDVHLLSGDNLFRQVVASGQEWRVYAESMPAPCTLQNVGPYLVRHTAAPYFGSERGRCAAWDLPMGSLTSGALHDDLTAGRLPALSMVVPDACHDMHGGHGCADDHLVRRGDTWLSQWMPVILDSPDYRSGKLVVIVTWDESSSHDDNHIPTIVISPTTTQVEDPTPQTHCTALRTIEDVLGLPPLGCAAGVAPATRRFNL
jgi:phospholipase C